MARFWERMGKAYGPKWFSQYGNADDGSWWQLLRHIDPDVIGRAILVAETSGNAWPPSKPEFIALCRAEMGIPDVSAAYRAANHCRWIHEVVYETARRIGVYEVRHRTEKQMLPEFERTYAKVCTEWMTGTRFRVPDPEQKVIGKVSAVKASPEIVNSELAKMRAMLARAGT